MCVLRFVRECGKGSTNSVNKKLMLANNVASYPERLGTRLANNGKVS